MNYIKKYTLIVLTLIESTQQLHGSFNVTVLGTGYVGLVSGTCLAQIGHNVICADIDQDKINRISQGEIPIYETDLSDLVTQNMKKNRLHFSSNIPESIEKSDIIMIAVNTPSKENGQADLAALESAIASIAKHINNYKLIVIKSTVPIGTSNQIKILLDSLEITKSSFDLISNPEFLREGIALYDCLHPDRIVIGSTNKKATKIIKKLYKNLPEKTPIVVTDPTTSEAIKYASNTFLALKISFMNELANLCDATGAHASTIAYAMGLDKRISPEFLKPGPGFGGSCFPKDSFALVHMAKEHNVPFLTVQAALQANDFQKTVPLTKLKSLIGNLAGKKIAILGLAFKSNTDDVRYSPAIAIICALQQEGATIQTYDPQAMANMKKLYPQISYCSDSYEALTGVHAAIFLTDWSEFSALDLKKAGKLMFAKTVVDCRNILTPIDLIENGFEYQTIGNGGTKNNFFSYYFCPDLISRNVYR